MAVKLKICGMRDTENIRSVANLLPDYMGFVFYEKSKRFTGENFVMPEISSRIKKVGVFVNEKKEKILSTAQKFNLDMVQLHGEELPELCRDLKSAVKIIKAFGMSNGFDFNVLERYKDHCDYFLFDTKTENYGGSGLTFDWALLHNYHLSTPFFLSGGIESEHLSQILSLQWQVSNLYAIDVNSKFETSAGMKDVKKLKEFQDELSSK